VLRRTQSNTAVEAPDAASGAISMGALRVDPAARSVTLAGEQITLTVREFDLLLFLLRNPGQVFSREQLLDHVWGFTFASDASTVTVHIRRLREKIEDDPANPRLLQTVWGVGYKFEKPK
jgi:two-component system, OmpR family, response regulator ResD